MAAPEQPGGRETQGGGAGLPDPAGVKIRPPRYGRYVALLAIVVLVLITINTIATKPNGGAGLASGTKLPPFAVPLALSDLPGDANVATGPNQGAAGHVPACSVRGPKVLNICQLYERGPVVLAVFVDGGSCPQVLSEMQALVTSYPQVSFAGVAIKGETAGVRKVIASKHLTFPVGLDRDGALAALYKVASCPQVTLARRGGEVDGKPLLGTPSASTLRGRVEELVADSRGGGQGG
jgi:AhpC/TSA family